MWTTSIIWVMYRRDRPKCDSRVSGMGMSSRALSYCGIGHVAATASASRRMAAIQGPHRHGSDAFELGSRRQCPVLVGSHWNLLWNQYDRYIGLGTMAAPLNLHGKQATQSKSKWARPARPMYVGAVNMLHRIPMLILQGY